MNPIDNLEEGEKSVSAKPAPLPDDVCREIAAMRGRVQDEAAVSVVGMEDAIDQILMTILAGGHALLEGVPGVAKTTLSKAFAHILGLDFQRIQFTPDLMPSDITGSDVLEEDRTTGRRVFRFVLVLYGLGLTVYGLHSILQFLSLLPSDVLGRNVSALLVDGAALILTPMCKRLSFRWGYVDQPDLERKIHAQAMPLLGGAAVFGAFALNIVVNYLVVMPAAARIRMKPTGSSLSRAIQLATPD